MLTRRIQMASAFGWWLVHSDGYPNRRTGFVICGDTWKGNTLTLFRLGYLELREAGGGSKRPAAYISTTICNKRLKIGMRGPGSKMRSPKVRFFLIAYYCGRTTHLLYAKLIFLRLSKYLIRPTDFKHHVDEIFMS